MEKAKAQTLEIIMRKLLTPIIIEAVDKASARHHIANVPQVQAPIEILDVKKNCRIAFIDGSYNIWTCSKTHYSKLQERETFVFSEG